jgi:hypothetical protein
MRVDVLCLFRHPTVADYACSAIQQGLSAAQVLTQPKRETGTSMAGEFTLTDGQSCALARQKRAPPRHYAMSNNVRRVAHV